MAPSDGGAGAVVAALLPNAKVWVNSETESWIGAEVVKTDGESVTVRLGKETKSFPAKDVYLAEPRTAAGVEDMVKLSYLHEPGVLHNLGFRYSMNEIYTYTGNILIAVNPFQRLPHLYNEIVMNQYRVSFHTTPTRTVQVILLPFKTPRLSGPKCPFPHRRGLFSASCRLTYSRSQTLRTGEPCFCMVPLLSGRLTASPSASPVRHVIICVPHSPDSRLIPRVQRHAEREHLSKHSRQRRVRRR